MGAYPATRTYTLRVKAAGAGSSYTLSGTWPVTADVDLELYNPSGTKVAQATGTTAKPESLSYTVTTGNTGDYSLKVLSKNFSATYTGSASYPEVAHANVTLRLKNPSGTVAATASGSSGSLTLNHLATAGGTWSLELVNNATDLTVPSFSATTRVPRTHTTATLQLKDAAGAVVAQNTSGDNPKGVTTTVSAGRYFLVVTPINAGTATLTASYPGRPARQVVTYDPEGHATSVDDGTTLVTARLSPSGRVIRRTVKDVATQDVLEDTLVGYADGGDSAAYAKPVAAGAVTTYLGGVVYTGTTVSWQLANLHGDIVGTTDAAGVFTATPPTDEFGVGKAPASRLGLLGEHRRFAVGGSLGLIRMGVRLYDLSVGRFTGVDPVEEGSANDYDYVASDPINNYDLDGSRCWTGVARWVVTKVYKKTKRWVSKKRGICTSISRGAGRVTRGMRSARFLAQAGAGAAVLAAPVVAGICVYTAGLGCAAAVVGAHAATSTVGYVVSTPKRKQS